MDVNEYEAQADTIDVDDITTNYNNRRFLRRVKRNDKDDEIIELCIEHDEDWEDCDYYFPEGAYDMGWLGYFVGKNEHLEVLNICPFEPRSGASVRDVMEPFLRGISSNKSIQTLSFGCMDLLGGEVFTMLTPLFKNNHNLIAINVNECDFGGEGVRLFALAIGSSTHKSLTVVDLRNSNISEEEMVDIITALSVYPHLQLLYLGWNCLRKNGCVALATLLECSATELENLGISRNDIGDEGIEALVPALANCSHLQSLNIYNNSSITTRGWQSLASILESPNSNLRELYIHGNIIDDQAASAFANALTNNHTLHTLYLENNPSITAVGWQAFSKVLCDTSSINATFLSNHMLQSVGQTEGNEITGPLLRLNRKDDKKVVATVKILQTHDDFDMQPFFEWDFKVLPLVLNWLERASEYEMPEDFEPNIEERKLSTIYQFVRGMPLLYVETCLRKELEDMKSKEKQMEEESQEEYLQRKLSLIEHRAQEEYYAKAWWQVTTEVKKMRTVLQMAGETWIVFHHG